jgi:integrase
VQLGLGKPPSEGFVFGTVDGKPRDPDRIAQDWKRFTAARRLPRVTLHALRHSHASALIAAGADPVTVSRRLGHGSPVITMSVYAHPIRPHRRGCCQGDQRDVQGRRLVPVPIGCQSGANFAVCSKIGRHA